MATFQSTDEKVLWQLPEYIAEQLPVIFTNRSSIDKEFLDILNFDVMRSGSFAAAEQRIQAALKTQHERNHLLYLQHHLAQNSRAAPEPFGDKPLGFMPSRQYLSTVWLDTMRPTVDFYRRYISTIKGRFLTMDHTFKSAKAIRSPDQQPLYKAILTVMNEYSQIAGQWFTHTCSLEEVRPALKLIAAKVPAWTGRHLCAKVRLLCANFLMLTSLHIQQILNQNIKYNKCANVLIVCRGQNISGWIILQCVATS